MSTKHKAPQNCECNSAAEILRWQY